MLAGVAVLACLGIAAIAFHGIYHTVTDLERPYIPDMPWTVVVSGEVTFGFLFVLGILLAWRRVPSPASRTLFMGLLVVGSVLLNVWASRGNIPAMAGHLVIVTGFFACAFVGKAAFTMLRGNKVRADRISGGQWFWHPLQSVRLHRWMATWGEPSYAAARERYLRLLFAIDIAQADPDVGRAPFRWRRNLPVMLRYQLATGELPELEPAGWQEAMAEHVREQLHPAAKVTRQDRRERKPESNDRDTGRDTAGNDRERTPESSDWPWTKDIDKAVLRRMVRTTAAKWERTHDGARMPATQLGSELKVSMSRNTATALLREHYGVPASAARAQASR
jgi:uncharacterized membrane protein YphA (DoxX/SURF4 family)